MKLSWCLAWADPELESQHHRNTGLVAHAIISALGEWRPEDPLEFKIILGSEMQQRRSSAPQATCSKSQNKSVATTKKWLSQDSESGLSDSKMYILLGPVRWLSE